MVTYKPYSSNDPTRTKVVRARPRTLGTEGCYDKSTPPVFIAESLKFTSKPTTKCSTLYPVYSNPRHEAGGPLAANVFKCQLKPTDAKDYSVQFSAADRPRPETIS